MSINPLNEMEDIISHPPLDETKKMEDEINIWVQKRKEQSRTGAVLAVLEKGWRHCSRTNRGIGEPSAFTCEWINSDGYYRSVTTILYEAQDEISMSTHLDNDADPMERPRHEFFYGHISHSAHYDMVVVGRFIQAGYALRMAHEFNETKIGQKKSILQKAESDYADAFQTLQVFTRAATAMSAKIKK